MDSPASYRKGLTLLELLIVVTLLALLAMLVVPMIGSTVIASELDVTYQTMQAVRDAVMGGATLPGYFQDMKGVPVTRAAPTALTLLADPLGLPAEVNDLFFNPGVSVNGAAFDPQVRKGWRGPYLSQTNGPLGTEPLTGKKLILDSFVRNGGAGSPIFIQWPPSGSTNFVRLVSYGSDGVPSPATNPATAVWPPSALSALNWGDDLILYIRRDLPGMDWSNYWELKKSIQGTH